MPHPTGQLLSGPITNGSTSAKFGTHVDYLGTGGYRTLATLAERDAIPVKNALEFDGQGSGMRRHLMLVGVQETGIIYILSIQNFESLPPVDQLAALADNDNWVNLTDFLNIPDSGVSQDYVDAQDAAIYQRIVDEADAARQDNDAIAIKELDSTLGVITIVTEKQTFTTDLNTPAPATMVSTGVLQDPYFQLPTSQTPYIGNPQWTSTQGWQILNGKAIGTNGEYLYQDVTIPLAGNYYFKLVVDAFTSGSLQITLSNGYTRNIPSAGDYLIPITLQASNLRIHLFGSNSFNGQLSRFDLLMEKTGLYFAGDKLDNLTLSGTVLTATRKNANSNVTVDLAPLLAGPDIYNVPTPVRNYVVQGDYNTSNELDMSTIPPGSVSGMRFSYQFYLYEYMPGDSGYLTWIRSRK